MAVKWQYHIIDYPALVDLGRADDDELDANEAAERGMNVLGADGWEALGLFEGTIDSVVFKRPIE